MKSGLLWSAVLALGLTLAINDAEAAKRLGGGKSFGMQREAVTAPKAPTAAPAAPTQSAAPIAGKPAAAAAGAPAAQAGRSWMGPIAGLAAGIGLAALASHFGFGEELASMLMIGLLVLAVMFVIGFIMRRRAAAAGPQPALAGAGGMQYRGSTPEFGGTGGAREVPAAPMAVAAGAAASGSGNIPADFDVEGFVRQAKLNFIRLQAANDAGNIEDIREFTAPEVFAEIRMGIDERRGAKQQTDVVMLEGEVLDVAEETSRYVVSVRFHGLLREDGENSPQPFDEVWHLTKPRDGSRGWVIAGIQQMQ